MKKLLITLFALLAVGCGKDKTVEEYQREKLRENLSLYESVAGVYTGVVNSKVDGSILGAMQLQLEAKTVATNPNGGEVAIGTPVLAGTVSFLDDSITVLSAPNGFYDPATGAYSAQITIIRSTGAAETVNLNGNLTAAALTGQIASAKYSDTGGSFQLVRNGRSLEDLLQESRPRRPGEVVDGARQVNTYTGTTNFQAGVSKAVRIVILQPLLSTAEDFLNIINPVKTVQASVNYGGRALQLQFNDATFDSRQGLLTGQTSFTVGGQSQKMTIDCRRTIGTKIRCTHLTSGSGITATTEAILDSGPSRDPQDGPDDRRSIRKTFTGSGVLPDSQRPSIMKLTVTLPSRSAFEALMELFFPVTERLMNITFNYTQNESVSMSGVKWDSLNGVLDGSRGTAENGGYIQYFQCEGFFFTETNEPFSCRFWSSRSPEFEINFKPPYR